MSALLFFLFRPKNNPSKEIKYGYPIFIWSCHALCLSLGRIPSAPLFAWSVGRVIIITEMNTIDNVPVFPSDTLPSQAQALLQGRAVQAECRLIRTGQGQSEGQMLAEGEVLLQIIEQAIIQRGENGQVISIVICDYETQFQIIRRPPPAANRLGDPSGIRFIFKQFSNCLVELSARQEQKPHLQAFARILSRKFIVQLGFHNAFKAIKKIGKGMTACVYNAVSFATGREVAIKSFKRSVYFAQDNGNGKVSFLSEFRMLTQVNHRNLCQLIAVFQTDNSTYVILELYPLSLYGYIQKFGFPSLEHGKAILINLLQGVAYLHEHGIMHRDLKLQNIMVKKESNGRVVPVIVDFGLAEYTSSQRYLYTRCGTPGYVAPEVLKIKSSDPIQTYTAACDIFSLGVIFHILLFKRPLFEGKEVKEVIKKNCDCEIDFTKDPYISLPADARHLLQIMLAKDPSQRISARDALTHPFLAEERKRLEIEMQSLYQTQNSIFA